MELGFITSGEVSSYDVKYTEKELEVFRKQVREVVVPAAAKLYERQKEALGIDTLYYYDESIASPSGNPVRSEIRNILSAKPRRCTVSFQGERRVL